MLDLSVIIGFRDWGLERLELALKSHALTDFEGASEVIVSDYGSENGREVEEVTRAQGGVYVRTEVDGPWSRSRALNAGIAEARGSALLTTDSDLLFSPAVHQRAFDRLMKDPRSVQLLQCRDLSEQFTPESIETFDWDAFEQHSVFRPRWGMGGMIAFRRTAYEAVGGLDERMEIYGGEDIDFGQRLSWAGLRINWIDDPHARIFHVWHPSSRKTVGSTPEGSLAIERNRSILLKDRTVIRNVRRRGWKLPIATVAIATYERAHFLPDCLASVLSQTVDNIEVLVVDDGSTDQTREVVASIDDPRIRYVRQDNGGVAKARNRSVAEATAPYLIVHDDDDLMLPWRVEAQLDAMVRGAHGSYGGWVDFDNDTGELTARPGKAFSSNAVLYSSAVLLHPTLMVRRDLLARFPYNERFRAGSDYNLLLRMASAGVKLQHTGEFHILRRLHGENLTSSLADHQQDSARRTTNLVRRGLNKTEEDAARKAARELRTARCRGQDNLDTHVGAFLPDRLVRRVVFFDESDSQTSDRARALLEQLGATCEEQYAVRHDGQLVKGAVLARDVTWTALHRLSALGLDVQVGKDGGSTKSGTEFEDELVQRVRDGLDEAKGFVTVTYCDASAGLKESLWAREDMVRRLLVVGSQQVIANIGTYDDLKTAITSISNGGAPRGTRSLIVDFTASDAPAQPVG